MLWVIVFSALAFAALVAIGLFGYRVWREGLALSRQIGRSTKLLGEHAAPLTEALERLGSSQSSPRRR
jgi:hypothetical protein